MKTPCIDHEFLSRAMRGNAPCLGEEKAPYMYRGHLLWIVQLLHSIGIGSDGGEMEPAITSMQVNPDKIRPYWPDRWGYLSEIICGNRLPEAPIPQISWRQYLPARKHLENMVDICCRYGPYSGFRAFIEYLAFGMGISEQPSSLPPECQEKLYRGLQLQQLMIGPWDYLGDMLSERTGKENPNAFFPTPLHVCELMAAISMHDENADSKGEDTRLRSFNDPCMGTGRMGLVASNHTLDISGQDIDYFVLLIAGINGCLYAPWMVVPVTTFLQKSITEPPPETKLSPEETKLIEPIKTEPKTEPKPEEIMSKASQPERRQVKPQLKLFQR